MKHLSKAAALAAMGALLFLQPGVRAQEAAQPQGFSASQLEQLAAPVALYPDSLLMQIYMAATYPLEVVEAERWVQKNPNIAGEAVDAALKDFDWDISVKSLCHFPDVLTRMADNLDWTRDVGDAFLGQQSDLLDATQRMRQSAYDAGNLNSGDEQTVTVTQEKIIVIEPSSPEVVYVPTYNPTAVYGSYWAYPPAYYPGMYAYPPGAGLFAFTAGAMVGAALWGNCHWGHGGGYADININNYNNFNKNTNVNWNQNNISNKSGNRTNWQHNPEHRGGVNYRDGQTAQRYGGSGNSTRVSSNQARGYTENRGGAGTSDRSASGRAQQGDRAGSGRQGADRATAQQRPSQGSQQRSGQSAARPSTQQKSSRDSALSGAGKSSSMERSSSQRGSASRSGTGGSQSRSGSSRSASSGSRSSGGRRR